MDISHLLVLRQARADLPALMRAYLGQAGDHAREILVVDNGSTDGTGAWLAELAASHAQLRVLPEADAAAPSLRLNQAAAQAQGTWLHVAELDAVPPVNLCAVMLPLLAQHFADGAHGLYRPTEGTLEEASGQGIESHPSYRLWDAPLDAVLAGTPPRSLLCRRELFLRAGGADARLALPDTALPLRLGAHAQRWLRVDAPLALGPRRVLNAAAQMQERHDAFHAYAQALQESPHLSPEQSRLLHRRALSAAWKQQRAAKTLPRPWPLLRHYVRSTWPGARVNAEGLALAATTFPRGTDHAPLD